MSLDRARLLVGDALWSPGTGLVEPQGSGGCGAAAVLDRDGNVLELGSARELAERHPELPRDEGRGLLLPGLVDCHAHLECAALEGKVPGGDGLSAWVSRLLRVRAGISRDALTEAARLAAKGMRELGTVAVGDVCTLLATAGILAEADLLGSSFLEVVGANEEDSIRALEDARAREASNPGTDRVAVRLVPHSAHGTTASALRALAGPSDVSASVDMADEAIALENPGLYAAGLALAGEGAVDVEAGLATGWGACDVPGVRSIHVDEHADEREWMTSGTGPFAAFLSGKGATSPRLSSVPYLDSLGALGSETLLVHMVLASPDELELARSRGATAVLCPRSNLHIGGRLPDLRAIRAAGVPYALGTDSLASTPDHDLLGEVRALAKAFPEIPLGELLAAATTGGAAALGLRSHPWVRIAKERIPELFERRAP
ncbi:amidohydrolase family protein [Vulgatibacter incomptus]|uniref:S-adenosylhomocysteine deaminase n=1 Tax=Vulgatibacter incomptus TaxID=1391653 RepID=A0A0K1P9P5_9BACT|nr:amidohydrolase family protein [Vulgatibacter incomptus]AKU89834.1 S-adenosylhomocysteine deaminase [Vulgatibacter incomptus]